MIDITLRQSIEELKKVQNLFRATEKITEVLESISKAESSARGAEAKVTAAHKTVESLTQDIEKLETKSKDMRAKYRQDARDLAATYATKKEELISDQKSLISNLDADTDAEKQKFESTKQEHETIVKALRTEESGLQSQLKSLIGSRDQLRERLGRV